MKILFNNNVLGGLIAFRGDVIEHFLAQGHEVVLVAPLPDDVKLLDRIPPKAKYIQIKLKRNSVSPFNDSKYLYSLFRIFRSEHPDHVFNYTIKPNIYGSIACKMLGIPSTAMLAGLGYSFSHGGLVAKIGRSLYKFALRFPQHVLFLNKDNVETANRIKLCKSDKITWLEGGEGVNLDKYPYKDNSADNPIFLFVARLLKEKGYNEFIQAAHEIKKTSPDVRFWVAGGLSLTSPGHVTEEEYKQNKQKGDAEHLGNVENMPQLYSMPGVVVVIPSYYSEGLNRSLMEACSAGKPIITTDMPGCRETVIDGKNGFLVIPKDVNSLICALNRYLNLSQKERNEMSFASRKLAEDLFDVRKVIAIYDSIINNRNN